jgi:hypothetical protein
MLQKLINRLLQYQLHQTIAEVCNICESQLSSTAIERLYEIADEVEDQVAEIERVPDEEELVMRMPMICEGCEE